MDSTVLTHCIDSYLSRTGFHHLNPKAALIDMDGTLLDSMGHHTAAWYRMACELGIKCTREEFYLYEGMTGAETINRLILRAFNRDATDTEKIGLYARKAEYFNELPYVQVIAGAQPMIQTLIMYGVKRVLVTGSGQKSNLDRLELDFPGAFSADLRITSANVSHCKPHPEPYLKAMTLADASPWQCIAIENAPLGVRSASTAGAFTIGVTTGPIPKQEMLNAGADIVFSSMELCAMAMPDLLSLCGLAPQTR